jgi:hypothetical protein
MLLTNTKIKAVEVLTTLTTARAIKYHAKVIIRLSHFNTLYSC